MRIMLSLCLLLVGGTAALAGHSLEHDDGLIVAGERVGPARLGMSAAEIDALNAVVPCPTTAAYDGEGVAVRLVTEWGGACRVSGDVQVGAGFLPALEMFGSPGAVVEDVRYSDVTAYWVSYPGWGIAFRVLVRADSLTLIQSIAVFPGTATGRWRARPPVTRWEEPSDGIEDSTDPKTNDIARSTHGGSCGQAARCMACRDRRRGRAAGGLG